VTSTPLRIVMKGPDCDHEHTGEYLVLDRPTRLVFTWISAETHGRATTVSVEIRAPRRGTDRADVDSRGPSGRDGCR